MKYNEIKLVDIANKMYSGGTPSRKNKDFWEYGNIPWLKTNQIGEYQVFDTEEHITKLALENSSTKLVKKNSIIIAMYGDGITRGKVSLAGKELTTNQACCILEINEEVADFKYVYFALKNNYKKLRFLSNGGAQQNLSVSNLKEFSISLLELSEQKKVGEFLHLLEIKMQNNNKIIQSIEQLSQTIFKHWFIDFEFPNEEGKPYKSSGGEMVRSELGEVPKGWTVLEVSDFANGNIITGKTPSTKQKENYAPQGIPFITIPDMHDIVYSIKTSKYISEIGVQTQVKKVIPKNSICVSCIATPGLVCITSRDSLFNQQINSFTPLLEELYYLFFSFKRLSNHIKDLGSSGSTTLNLNKTQFSKIKIIRPQQNILESFNEIIKPIFEMILTLSTENINLQQLRDTLLPKLLSGEIEIPDELEV